MSTSAQIAANQANAQHSCGATLCTVHQPQNEGEVMLVEKMAQHYWLAQRALKLQDQCFSTEQPLVEQEKQLALYLRYQTTHDRAFHKCADELRKVRNEKRKWQIGFAGGTCKIRTIGSGQVTLGASFEDADKALRCEAAA